jgi:hypothetical protein
MGRRELHDLGRPFLSLRQEPSSEQTLTSGVLSHYAKTLTAIGSAED